MSFKKFGIALTCVCSFAVASFAQSTPAFTRLVVFGDSLSDTGNVRARTSAKSSGAIDYPSHTFNYDNGRFTNDTDTDPSSNTYIGVWHEQLARTFLGLPAATNSLGGSTGLNYAFGSATTNDGTHEEVISTPVADITITIDDMGKQVDDYLAQHTVDAAALYIVWGGSNDIRDDRSSSSVTATVGRVDGLISRLATAGAKYIMVPNVVPIGDIPQDAGTAKGATENQAAAEYRTELAASLDALQSTLATQGFTPTIYRVDEWADVVRIFSNGPRFGFTNITSPSQDNSSADPDHYLFWDDIHPTTAGHYRLALTAFNAIVGPSPSPAKALNISSRMFVDTGERVAIAGFVVTGDVPKKVLIRGLGPSLTASSVPSVLADPTLTLFDVSGNSQASNDDWRQSANASDIMNSGLAPTDDKESAILVTLNPGQYTTQLAGKDNGTGNGIIEIYDVSGSATATFANLSTRGYVGINDDVLIAGVAIGNGDSPIMVFRALGPSLAGFGIVNPLLDPTLELFDSNGTSIGFNNDWQTPQVQAMRAVNLAPTNDRESAIVNAFLSPGNYTAVVRGANNTTGVALVEAYRVP
ncbi:MAG TPA: SGNH/GDSL hydrolase family protein [Chthoniobacterales bacterium]|nr:SGNH/GDSL hydrolase family protein [Chthoniobacterales bacterium]